VKASHLAPPYASTLDDADGAHRARPLLAGRKQKPAQPRGRLLSVFHHSKVLAGAKWCHAIPSDGRPATKRTAGRSTVLLCCGQKGHK
jgi:hypothetical protein